MFPRTILALALCTPLAACSNGAWDTGTTSIANGSVVVRGDRVILHGNGGAKGNLDAAGNLEINGRTITVDANQREQLRSYYQGAHAVREHGIATGKAGAAIAMQSLKTAAVHVTGGDDKQSDAKLDAATSRVDQEASKICLDLQQIMTAQASLATSLDAFKPFGGIVHGDDDCSTTVAWHDADHAITLKSGDGEGIKVTSTEPATVWGLQQGDVILAVDGHPVDKLNDLLKQLDASKPKPVAIRVRRDKAEQEITIAEGDYTNLAASASAKTSAN
ncbi:PDZ domain-containing protein [Dyella sp. 20L07]|uniref:PDZ domain-containing protein n=1 Tax=Dyella sp. 20L07 TaxID=3384240 RepID=UPI003D2BE1EF